MPKKFSLEEIPRLEKLGDEIQLEKIHYGNHPSAIHLWWGKLPMVIARAAVYHALSSETEQDSAFIEQLCTYPGNEEFLDEARQRIRKSIKLSKEVDEINECRPRVLDVFSGSGMIPLEAERLGNDAYALDLNPVAYLIQLCTLYYPQKYGTPVTEARGSAPDGTWAGLSKETQFWCEWVHEKTKKEINDLYPSIIFPENENSSEKVLTPAAYIWASTIKCRDCKVVLPMTRSGWLVKKPKRYIAFKPEFNEAERQVNLHIVKSVTLEGLGFEPEPTISRGKMRCPVCDAQLDHDFIKTESRASRLGRKLLAVICHNDRGEKIYVEGNDAQITLLDEATIQQKIAQLQQQTGLTLPDEPIPNNPTLSTEEYGRTQYKDLFMARQLLTLLVYTKYIHYAYGQMHSRRMEPERAKAVTTLLGLMFDNVVNFNSKQCAWRPTTERVDPIFIRPQLKINWHFAEMNPLAQSAVKNFRLDISNAAIEQCAQTGQPARVFCASATQLPFEDNFFDAIITDPPYYDNINYSELSDFFYVWLNRSIGHLYPEIFREQLTAKEAEIVVAKHKHTGNRDMAVNAYEKVMGEALREAARVLKPGRLFSVLLHSPKQDALDLFFNVTQKAGLELYDAKWIRLPHLLIDKENSRYELLLAFKKSTLIQLVPESNTDAKTVLRLAGEGKPAKYKGLKALFQSELSAEELDWCIPRDFKGSLDARLEEYIRSCEDPSNLLTEMLGNPGIIRAARNMRLKQEKDRPDIAFLRNEILRHFGFNVPEPDEEGVVAAISEIEKLKSGLILAKNVVELRGSILTCMTSVESQLERAIRAWALVCFGDAKNKHLQVLAEKPLDKLSMGDIKRIFSQLPDYIIRSNMADRVYQQFGRHHIYKPKKYIKHLDNLVSLRNTVEHNKDDYIETSPLEQIRQDFIEGVDIANQVLTGLREIGAIPSIVKPVREIEDMYGRRSVELQVEDGTIKEIYADHSLKLGHNYIFFRVETNPRPVNPPLCLLSDV